MKRCAIGALLFLASAMLFAWGSTEEEDGFSYEGIRELIVEGETFRVVIQGTRSGMTLLEIVNKPNDWHVLHSRSGDKLRVWVDRDFSLFSQPHRAELNFHVPDDIEVTVGNTTGSVRVQTMRSNSVGIDTSTGSIEIEDVTADIRAKATTGSISILDSAGEFDVDTTTGNVELVRTNGEMHVRSSTGRQLYRDVIGNLDARSSTGNIDIENIQGRLQLETSTGSQSGRGIVLTGDSSFESSTGSIEMDLVNSVEELQFDLRSTTGSLEVGHDRSQRQLFLSGTGFRVTGKSSTGSQRFF